ncbi:MAG TPA: transporter substrate-binding domain-containing protein [Castellaniella sp.]|nr:transporter substrate-binding domain-containing protein [Castellaniella sp.]
MMGGYMATRRRIAACLLGIGLGALGLSTSAAAVAVGVAQVPATSVPGAKVRTAARIEVLAARQVVGLTGSVQVIPDPDHAAAMLKQGGIDSWLGVADPAALGSAVQASDLHYSLSPLAILRTDTDIHDWRALSGRTVCLAADGRYVGEVSARYGAIEQVYPSVTDALLGVRTGACDAMVHDQAFLEALLKFPEWKKFSARLEPYRQVSLLRVVASQASGKTLGPVLKATSPSGLAALTAGQARDIAFEVYLDQVVPDCH